MTYKEATYLLIYIQPINWIKIIAMEVKASNNISLYKFIFFLILFLMA